MTFVVYYLLPPVFPGLTAYRSALELTLPVALSLIALAPVRSALGGLAALAAGQLVLLFVLGGIELSHTSASMVGTPPVDTTGRATANTALLFACAGLPLYLGAEIRGGARTVRRGRGLAGAVGLGTAGSTLAPIVAEHLALGRLLHWLHGPLLRSVIAWIAVPFVAADAISLVGPERFYDDLLKPSLGALFVSQHIVFAAFPRTRRSAAAIGAATVASGLAAWGLYTLLAGAAST